MTFFAESALLAADVESFRRQEMIFAALNFLLFAALLLFHIILVPLFAPASAAEVAGLTIGLILQGGELVWLRRQKTALSPRAMKVLTWWSIVLNSILATVLSVLTHEEDSQYFVLMVVPILEAAFRLPLPPLIATVALADFLNFFGVYTLASVSEYFEAATASLIFTLVGILVWMLVNNLRDSTSRLKHNLEELGQTRERLLVEEKLAAVGRLSSAIAHEIRNPVAMISSSLATAARPATNEEDRKQMFAIATAEAARLERLTGDFLTYARPREVRIAPAKPADTLSYVAALARARAADSGTAINVEASGDLEAAFDAPLIQQALLNLVLNAIEACDGAGPVTLKAAANGDATLRFDVIDPAGPIPPDALAHIFEPFFTTKPGGTGLGLAIARNVARAHRGDLSLTINEPGRVCFSIEIPRVTGSAAGVESPDGHNSRR